MLCIIVAAPKAAISLQMFFNSYNSIVIAISCPPVTFTLEIVPYAFGAILFFHIAEPSKCPTSKGKNDMPPIYKHGNGATQGDNTPNTHTD